jgi:menaquinone-dependent protoporphyrinogen oxidase
MAAQIRKAGHHADLHPVENCPDMGGYHAVLIGAPIRYDKWTDTARRFVLDHRAALAAIPHGAFFTCLTLARPGEKPQKQARAYGAAIAAQLPDVWPADIGGFAGVLDYSKFPRRARLFARLLFAFLRVPQGDHRDPGSIRHWTAEQIRRVETIPTSAAGTTPVMKP